MDTSGSLADYAKMKILSKVKKGVVANISKMKEMDMKAIGGLVVVAAGVLCGLVLLMR